MTYLMFGGCFDVLASTLRTELSLDNYTDADIFAGMALIGFEQYLGRERVLRILTGKSDCWHCEHCEGIEDGETQTVHCKKALTDEDTEKADAEHCPHYKEVVG